MFTAAQAQSFKEQHRDISIGLLHLHAGFMAEAAKLTPEQGREYLRYGVARRLYLMVVTLGNIYRVFPPDRAETLTIAQVADVQINLQAYVINLAGCFDCMAWAFVLRHALPVRKPNGVGLFLTRTSQFLPKALQDYLSAPEMREWQQRYLKDYRDALAHRIPLFIPPAQMTPDEHMRYRELEAAKIEALMHLDMNRSDALAAEQAAIGSPSFMFAHSVETENPSRPVWLHPQILSDAVGLTQFARLFLAHWHERAS